MNLSIRTPSSHSRVVYKDPTRETTKGCSLTSLLSKFRNIDGVALKKIDQICSCSQRGMAASSRLSSKTSVSLITAFGFFLLAQALTIAFESSTVAFEATAFPVTSPYSRSAGPDFRFKMGAKKKVFWIC